MVTEREVVAKGSCCTSRISWSALIAGAVLALGIQMVLSLLGASIGLGAFNPDKGMGNIGAIGVGTALWWFITGLVSLFFGGMVSARFSPVATKAEGGVQGLLMWALASVVSIFIITTSLGILIGGGLGLIGRGISAGGEFAAKTVAVGAGAAGAAGAAAASSERVDINRSISEMLGLQLPTDPQHIRETGSEYADVVEAATAYLRNPEAQDKKENLINTLTQSGLSRQDAEDKVNKLQQNYSMLKQRAGEFATAAGDAAATASQALAKVSLAAFFTLLLGAVAAYWGGTVGAPLYTREDHIHRTV